jgi:molecular chaperone GrpE (heat shock protein)
MVNLKKNHLEEKKLFTSLGKEALLEEIIPGLDNFDAAFSNKEA